VKRIHAGAAVSLSVLWLLTGCAGGAARSGATGQPSTPVSDYRPVETIVTGTSRTRAKAHTDLGLAYLEAGNVAVALDEGRKALGDDSSYASAHNLMGLAHMYLDEKGLARESFEQALRLGGNDPDINNNFGWFLCQNGDTTRAMAMFEAAATNPLYPTPTRPLTNAALCAIKANDMQAAEVNFLRAIAADSNNAQAVFGLASLFFHKGDYLEARRQLSDFHTLRDPVAESLWLAVRIERKLGDKVSESGYASQLRRKFAGSPEHQLLMQGKFD
jgi:type IV pilus assembly protein PilF